VTPPISFTFQRYLVAAVLAVAASLVLITNPATANPDLERYVALGDSYVAGPGIAQQIDPRCGRSDHNYPHVAAAKLGMELKDVSCGNATTKELSEPQRDQQGNQINAPQLDALNEDTDVVTLGIGGNDIGFSEIVRTCVTRGLINPTGNPCQRHYTETGTDQLVAAIGATAPKVATALDEIHRRAPDAQVFVVGYPTILPATGPGCFLTVPIAAGDVPYLRDVVIGGLNTMLASTAQAHNANFIDTATPTVGHDVCQPSGVRYIEGVNPAPPAAAVHPNAAGMAAIGDVVARALGAQPTTTPPATTSASQPVTAPTQRVVHVAKKPSSLPKTGTAIAGLIGTSALLLIVGITMTSWARRHKAMSDFR
jgi:lysophospholipase L1-like esterase